MLTQKSVVALNWCQRNVTTCLFSALQKPPNFSSPNAPRYLWKKTTLEIELVFLLSNIVTYLHIHCNPLLTIVPIVIWKLDNTPFLLRNRWLKPQKNIINCTWCWHILRLTSHLSVLYKPKSRLQYNVLKNYDCVQYVIRKNMYNWTTMVAQCHLSCFQG